MMLLAGATLADGSCVDLRLRGGRIDAIGPSGTLGAGGEERLELAGYVLLPAPAEPHAHLDKTLTAERFTTQPGDLLAAIAAWDAHRRTLGEADIAERAKAALRDALARGA